jgi:hypothetical protein
VPNPGDPQSLNRYSYVLNNPMRFTDPTGHCGCDANYGPCPPCDSGSSSSSEVVWYDPSTWFGSGSSGGNSGGSTGTVGNGSGSNSSNFDVMIYSGGNAGSSTSIPTNIYSSLTDYVLFGQTTSIGGNSYGPYSTESENNGDFSARLPDYFSVNVNVAVPNPVTLTYVGISGQVAVDRDGNVYGGIGPTIGKSATMASFSATGGWLLQGTRPTTSTLNNFMTGHSLNIGGGARGGYVGLNGLVGNGNALEIGIASPQAGGSYHYSTNLVNLPLLSW